MMEHHTLFFLFKSNPFDFLFIQKIYARKIYALYLKKLILNVWGLPHMLFSAYYIKEIKKMYILHLINILLVKNVCTTYFHCRNQNYMLHCAHTPNGVVLNSDIFLWEGFLHIPSAC